MEANGEPSQTNFLRKSRFSKLAIIVVGFVILFTFIGHISGDRKIKEGKETESQALSTPSPDPTPRSAPIQKGVCPTKKATNYAVVKCVVLLDNQNNSFNSLYVVISPSLRLQEAKVKSLVNAIKINECPKNCSISIFDDEETANKAYTFNLLGESDQKKWEKDNPAFFGTGGTLYIHYIAEYDSEEDRFDYLVELPDPSPQRKIVKGSTPEGIEFYEKVDALRKQGKVNGELCTEFESDAVVDVNPDSPAVQLSLMYSSITDSVDNQDKALIMNDFRVIKALAEQDDGLVLPDYGTLRLFVLTFHDNSCIGKGELQQLMIDPVPEWFIW